MQRIALIFFFFFFMNCAAFTKYMRDRGNDLRDIPIFGLEANVYGSNTVTFLPAIGIAQNKNGIGIGIRHSHIGKYKVGDPNNKVVLMNWYNDHDEYDTYFGNPFPMGNSFHEPMNADTLRVNNKIYRVFTGNRCGRKLIIRYKDSTQSCHYYENVEFYPVELSVGIFLGLRIGFSAGELVDFFAGIFGFDPMDDDDIFYIIYRELPQPTSQNQTWESKLDALDEKMDSRAKK